MAAKPPDAFLSYTRFDDRHGGGAISEFCRRLASAVQAVTGVPFDIFQDVEGIGVGEHWRGKLNQMLNEARFFIPIVTPSYFTSKPCRDELEKFLRAEAERERNDLVLPIYYIESEVWRMPVFAPPILWREPCTNASGRTGGSFALSRSRPGMSGEPWNGWRVRSSKPAGARCYLRRHGSGTRPRLLGQRSPRLAPARLSATRMRRGARSWW
jgi:hypothetical protein